MGKIVTVDNMFGFNLIEHHSPASVGENAENDINILVNKNPDQETDVKHYSCRMAENTVEMELPRLGWFRVENGNRITIRHNSTVDAKDTLPFLYGACIGASLYQRGIIPLHGSAVDTKKGAVLFLGVSGSGKSTIAAAMISRGYPFLCDDICAIRIHDGNPVMMASYANLKLWKNALVMLNKSTAGLNPIRSNLEKYFFPADSNPARQYHFIHKIYIVNIHNNETVELSAPIKGKEKFNKVKHHAYRKKLMNGLNRQQTYFNTIMPLLSKTTVKTVSRPRNGYFQELIDRLEADMLL